MTFMRMTYVSGIVRCNFAMYSHSIADHIAEAVDLILLAHINVLQEAQIATIRRIRIVPASLNAK